MIICDTNVWYDLGSGKIPKSGIEGTQLVCTHINLRELVNSYNLVTNFEAVKNAVKAIRSYASHYYLENPFECGIKKLVPSFIINEEYGERILNEAMELVNVSINIPADRIDELKNYYEDSNKSYKDSVGDMNEIARKIKEDIKEKGTKKERRKEDTTQRARMFFARLASDYSDQHYPETKSVIVQEDVENWEKLELFIEVLADYFKEIELSPTQKIQPNDWADVLNMVYVGKDDLYWTGESKWNRFIEKNENATKYLFKLETSNSKL